METKQCEQCLEIKNISDFGKRKCKKVKDGNTIISEYYYRKCKICKRKKDRVREIRYYYNNHEKAKKQRKDYEVRNKDKVKKKKKIIQAKK